jgi:hypothetical protein
MLGLGSINVQQPDGGCGPAEPYDEGVTVHHPRDYSLVTDLATIGG